MKFYPDISANDHAIQIAIARNFRKLQKEAIRPIDYQWTIRIALYPARRNKKKVRLMRCIFTNRTIGMMCFSIGTNRTIGTNGPSELPCTQLDHIRK